MVRLENIGKSYHKDKYEISILKSINCTINEGEMVALMGRSGSGKTTLINILSGLSKQTSGKYFFDSNDVSEYSIKKRDEFREKYIGIIVQNYALLSSMTAYENIALPLKYRKAGREEIKTKVGEISKNLDIENCLEKRIFQLSGGECQRVAIARALIKKPSLILADEPTGSLDSENERGIMNIFKQLKNMGNSIIIATHSKYVSECCDRVLEINDGNIYWF